MKKIALTLTIIFTVSLAASGQCVPGPNLSCTPGINLNLPGVNYLNWNVPLNDNFNLLDSYLSGTKPIPSIQVTGTLAAGATITTSTPFVDCRSTAYSGGAKCDAVTDDTAALKACFNAAGQTTDTASTVWLPKGICNFSSTLKIPPQVASGGVITSLHGIAIRGQAQQAGFWSTPQGGTILRWTGGDTASTGYAVPVGMDWFDVAASTLTGVTLDMQNAANSIAIWYHSDCAPGSCPATSAPTSRNIIEHNTFANYHQGLVVGLPDATSGTDAAHTAEADSLMLTDNHFFGGGVDLTAVGLWLNLTNGLQQSWVKNNQFRQHAIDIRIVNHNGGLQIDGNEADGGVLSTTPVAPGATGMAGVYGRTFLYLDASLTTPPLLRNNETEGWKLWSVYDLSNQACSSIRFNEQWEWNPFNSAILAAGCQTITSHTTQGGNPYYAAHIVAGSAAIISENDEGTWLTASRVHAFGVAIPPRYPAGSLVIDANGNLEQALSAASGNCSAAPIWGTTLGEIVTEPDCGVQWQMLGVIPAGGRTQTLTCSSSQCSLTTDAVTTNAVTTSTLNVTGGEQQLPYLGVGTAPAANIGVNVGGSGLTEDAERAFYAGLTYSSASTTNAIDFMSKSKTQASAFTITNKFGFYADDTQLGDGSGIGTQYGFYCNALTSGTSNWCFYAQGTTPSYFGGDVTVVGKVSVGVGGSANHAICWKADGKALGYCSAVVAADGTCGSCN